MDFNAPTGILGHLGTFPTGPQPVVRPRLHQVTRSPLADIWRRKQNYPFYNLTYDVTVTSFHMAPTLNFDTTTATYSGRCVQNFKSLSLCVATISSDK